MTAGPVSCIGPIALVLGRLAMALGRAEESRAHLEVARVQIDQLASPLWKGHVAAALAALDPEAADLPAGLSKREAEVLGQIAAGLTNKEVAARLHLSVRTIDTHVGSIYRKVGARHRTEAVAFALANGIEASAENR
jgi:DNA-binding NarL/FixJ family response regulator